MVGKRKKVVKGDNKDEGGDGSNDDTLTAGWPGNLLQYLSPLIHQATGKERDDGDKEKKKRKRKKMDGL